VVFAVSLNCSQDLQLKSVLYAVLILGPRMQNIVTGPKRPDIRRHQQLLLKSNKA